MEFINEVKMKFAESHEWITIEGDVGVVGITHHAQEQLGEIVYVELPEINAIVEAGEEIAVLESTKAAADIYTPVSGEIIAVNEALKTSPYLLNEDPEIEGWIYKIKLTAISELDTLLTPLQYLHMIS